MEDERRNFFRLDASIYIEYRHLLAEERDTIKQAKDKIQPPKDGFSLELEQVSRQLGPLLATLRKDMPGVVQYLEGINRKIDIVAGLVLFERMKSESGDKRMIATTNTLDLSEGGASFETKEPLDLGVYIHIKLVMLGARFGIETYAEVMHSLPVQTTEGEDIYRVGIEFPMMAESDRKLLTRYILDRQREQIRIRKEQDS